MKDYITVIGGGLAGCEAAYQIAKAGIKVKLYEMKPLKYSDKISSFPKNEPKNTPKIALEIPKRTPTPPNFKLNFFSATRPTKERIMPCPKSPNIIPNNKVYEIATNNVGSTSL